MGDGGSTSEAAWGAGRALGLGWPEPRDSIGIDRRLALLDAISPLRGEAVLDGGCGNGSYTERLAEGFDRIAGSRSSPPASSSSGTA